MRSEDFKSLFLQKFELFLEKRKELSGCSENYNFRINVIS
jgi:hypothetical protein